MSFIQLEPKYHKGSIKPNQQIYKVNLKSRFKIIEQEKHKITHQSDDHENSDNWTEGGAD